MSSVLAWLPADGWQRLLCDALWQSTLIAGCGWLMARYLVRQSAAGAWLLLLTLTACVLLPLASFAAREQGWTLLSARADAAMPIEPMVDSGNNGLNDLAPTEAQGLQLVGLAAPSTFIDAGRSDAGNVMRQVSVFVVVGAVWITASSLRIVRLTLSLLATLRLLQRATPCDDSALQAAMSNAARRVGLHKPPQLLISDDVGTPTVFAFGRPRLLVPAADLAGPTRSDRDDRGVCVQSVDRDKVDWAAAFTHELAHVARGDGWSRLWAELTIILLPLQPLMWLLRRSFHTACEEACDDWVVATGTNPVDFADTLTAWCDMPRRPAAQFAIGMSSTKSRVLRLLALREKPAAALGRGIRWATTPAAFALVTVVALAQPAEPRPSPTAPSESRVTGFDKPATDDEIVAELKELWLKINGAREGRIELSLKQLTDILIRVAGLGEKLKKQAPQCFDEWQSAIEMAKNDYNLMCHVALQERAKEERAKARRPSEKAPVSLPPYVIEPPDILIVNPVRLVPKAVTKVEPFDKVRIAVDGTLANQPINETFTVDSAGEVVLGPTYGAVKIGGLTRREAQDAVKNALSVVLKDPQAALIIDEGRRVSGIGGEHLVGPDGRINLGTYGGVYVAGLTVAKATQAIEAQVAESFVDPKVAVDVFSYNSKVYYVIVEGGGLGDNIQRFPITGNETVLDAISNIKGLNRLSSRKIWISRPGANGEEKVLPVNWNDVVSGRSTTTNYQILPGDRLVIAADKEAVERESKERQKRPPPDLDPF